MRPIILSVALVTIPIAALAAPQCAAPDPTSTDRMVVPLPPVGRIGEPVPKAKPDGPTTSDVPALEHIRSAGATLTELVPSHGLRTVFARHGTKFQVFYVTPDGQAVVGGVMWDASGKNVTRAQVASIPGTIPTVTIGPDVPSHTAMGDAPGVGAAATPALVLTAERTAHGILGSPSAPKLWMFIDPMCSYSIRAMDALKPYVTAGRVQLAVIPVSVLDYEDHGKSTAAAQLMLSQPMHNMVQAWQDHQLTGSPDPAAIVKLASNMATADALHLKGTPTFIWRRADGTEGMSAGVPPDLDTLLASISS